MQLILELLKKIFVALQGVYTKQETDAALATKADATALTEEAQAREQADKQAAQERESARLREQWKSQTYAEFHFKNTSTTTTRYDLFKITANGAWWIDFGDGNGAHLQTELEATPVLDFGSDTQRLVRIYGAVTGIVKADSRPTFDSIVLSKAVIDGEAITTVSGIVKFISSKDTEFFAICPNAIVGIAKRDAGNSILIGKVVVDAKGFDFAASINDAVFRISNGNINAAGVGGYTLDRFVVYSTASTLSVSMHNTILYDYFLLDSMVVSTSTDFRFLYGVKPTAVVKIRLPKLSSAPNFFSGYSANRFSLAQMLPTLESLPVWSDGATHNFGIHCYYTETTDTFTATDSDGVEYSLENCPSFDEDDAEQTFRKAYVLTIAKKGWTILLKNKNA